MFGNRTPARGALALAFLAVGVLLAGCSLFDAPDRDTRTLTPVSVPANDSQGGAVDGLPPGVTPSGVSDAATLVAAHRRVLSTTSFVVVSNRTVRASNETLWRSTVRAWVEDGGERYHYALASSASESYSLSSPAKCIEWWYDGERVLERYEFETGNVRFGYDPDPSVGGPFRDPVDANRIFTLFAQVGGEPVDHTTRNGTTLYRIDGAAGAAPPTLPHAVSSREFAYSSLVDSSGVVRSYRLSYEATFDNRSIRVRRDVRFLAIGDTTVPRPAWYERALASRSTATSTTSSSSAPASSRTSCRPSS